MSFLNLYLKDSSSGELSSFPVVFSERQPVICWDIPEGVDQVSFCLELKTKDLTVLSTGEIGYAYYTSGLVYSNSSEHQIAFEMFPAVWQGIIEVRLRIFNDNGRVVFSTHSLSSEEYSFEPVPQGFSWDSNYDGYYLLMDSEMENIFNTVSPIFAWRNVSDIDAGQNISYELQWSKTPLFDSGYFNRIGESYVHNEELNSNLGLRSNISSEILMKGPIFYRVRAFDGLDYGEWSRVNGFLYSPSYAPICFFDSVITNCDSSDSNINVRPNGEIFISFHVVDIDSNYVSVYFSYEIDGIETPLSFDSSMVKIPTNENVTVVWPSARQISNSIQNIHLKMYAKDDDKQSDIVQFDSIVLINNLGLGYGNGDIGGDDLNYRLKSGLKDYQNWIQIPDVKAQKTVSQYDVFYRPKPLPTPPQGQSLKEPFSWEDYWMSKLGDEYSKYKFWIGNEYDQTLKEKIVRQYFSLYNGFNDRNEQLRQLLLQYEDEFNETKEEGETFSEYLRENIEACKKWCQQQDPPIEYSESAVKLGKSVKDIQFFLKEPLYGRFINIHGSNIVKAGTSGLYYDGMVLENSSKDIFKSDKQDENSNDELDNESQEESLPDGASDLKKKEVWKHWYQIDRMYEPKKDIGNSGDNISTTIVGPNIPSRFDSQGYWYWQLFEYSLSLNFPLIIDSSNCNFMYRFNGDIISGSLLKNKNDILRFDVSDINSEEFKIFIERMFPTSIFQEIILNNIHLEGSKAIVDIYSNWSDKNHEFQFLETENSVYETFRIGFGKQFSRRVKINSGGTFIEKQMEGESEDKIEFDISPDSGKWIGSLDVLETEEPLFTCDKYHVNSNGCHFKYTPERFSISKKVYVRKYKVVPVFCEKSNEAMREPESGETSVPVLNYCNFKIKKIGENVLGDVLYEKIPLRRLGGLNPQRKEISVEFEGETVIDIGWWMASGNISNNSECFSHKWDAEKGVFKRNDPEEIVKKAGFKPCYVAEYVDIEEAWEKPLIDKNDGIGKLNRKQPVHHFGTIPVGYIQYVQGAYIPPTDKNNIDISEEQEKKGITSDDLVQTEEISSYDSNFSSIVYPTKDHTGNIGRYNDNWNDNDQKTVFDKIRTVVDPIFFEVGGYEWSIMKFGYQPDITLQEYFKEDEEGIWKDRIIPFNSSYVHKIYKAEDNEEPMNSSLNQIYHGKIIKNLQIISDASTVDLPSFEGTKQKYLDYPVKASSPREIKDYFSSLPIEESEEYANRPIGPYGEDRPTRITGYIDSLSQLLQWRFIYLQTEWNTYNLIHWEGNQDEYIHAKIEVAEVKNGQTGEFMTLQTKNAIWFDKFQCWLIPFQKLRQSAYVDTLNGKFLSFNDDGSKKYNSFVDGNTYKFRISGLNVNSGSQTSTVISSQFRYSKSAYSPVVVTSTDFNQWTGEFTIEFRFDDALGRKYDITNIYYVIYDKYSSASPESEYIEIDIKNIIGETTDLDSNIFGDDVVNESYIIKHKIYIPNGVIPLSEMEGKYLRFRIESIPSEDRDGLTVPVFHFRMWANELLRKSDKTISLLAGHSNHWVLVDKYDEDGNYSQEWKYLPDGKEVYVPGLMEEQNSIISEIDAKFEDWYVNSAAKFDFQGFDAKHSFLLSTVSGDGDLYLSIAEDFISMDRPADEDHEDTWNYSEEWADFISDHSDQTRRYLAPIFIKEIGEVNEFNLYWDNYGPFEISVNSNKFLQWWQNHNVLSLAECRNLFVQLSEYAEDYSKYLEDHSLEDSDESRSSFISENSLTEEFNIYEKKVNSYHDGRYEERKNFIDSNYNSEFEDWILEPVNVYGEEVPIYGLTEDLTFKSGKKYFIKSGNAYSETTVVAGETVTENTYYDIKVTDDDICLLFIASSREIWESFTIVNYPKSEARGYFLTMSQNGMTYGQQMQTAYENINIYSSRLNEAYAARLEFENNHRKKLILKGFFSNGWKNNEAYLETGDQNDVFRFRVENQPATGDVNKDEESGISSDIVVPVVGYDTRWEVYFHWQMDFYDSFDSQYGRPFRDYLYMRADLLGYSGSDSETWMRIQGAIEADSGGMSVLPGNVYTPKSNDKILSPTTDDPYSYQLAGRFAILKTDLPGLGQYDPFTEKRTVDILPKYWNREDSRDINDWNQLYFWRVCPYNLVKKPLMEKEFGKEGEISNYSSGYWRFDFINQINGDRNYLQLVTNEHEQYDNSYKYGWISTSKLNSPIWKKDSESTCFNSNEGYVSLFFQGTDANRMNISYKSNSIRSSYMQRIQNGEAVFLTDRPREINNNTLSYVEDSIGHFRTTWLPLQSERGRLWVLKDNEDKTWYAVSQKTSRDHGTYLENCIVLSRGLSPQCWGDVMQIIPLSPMEESKDILEDVVSFENPCIVKTNEYVIFFTADIGEDKIILKGTGNSIDSISELEIVQDEYMDGFLEIDSSDIDPSEYYYEGATNIQVSRLLRRSTWLVYCNAIKSNNDILIIRTSSYDLLEWSPPETVSISGNVKYPAVYLNDDGWMMLGTIDQSIVKYVSTNGIEWEFDSTVFSEQYEIVRPTLCNGRIYFSMEVTVIGLSVFSKIYSVDESGEYSTLRVEKGNPINIEMSTMPTSGDIWFDPFVFEDIDKGIPVARMMYHTSDNIWAYSSGSLEKTDKKEEHWFTEYLEEYEWNRFALNYDPSDSMAYYLSAFSINGSYVPIMMDKNGDKINLEYGNNLIPIGKLSILVKSNDRPLAIKLPFYSADEFEDIRSEGEWIDFYNVKDTEAWLNPEDKDEDYLESDYTAYEYILEFDLFSEYLGWMAIHYPGEEQTERTMIEFLLDSRRYSLYLKWSKKGPGVYRYLFSVRQMNYWGSGE